MNKTLTFDQKYALIGTPEASQWEGQFVTAVTSTGIFCRPACRARKPKAANVQFYDNAQQALQHGFRPCKVCRPMEKLGETPTVIQSLIDQLHANPYQRIKDQDLRQQGLDPSTLRRWFKTHHNVTFHGYQRLIRINAAFKALQEGQSVLAAAMESGYDSLSGFNDGFKQLFGYSAGDKRQLKTVIHIQRFTTPIGPMFACATDQGICLVDFTDRKMLETEFKDLCKRLNAVILPGEHPHVTQVQHELAEYFQGQRQSFSVPLHTPGTDFQQAVWAVLQQIPYGDTWSYAQQAEVLGNPKAVRAVATANGMNKVGILIPCHRVIGSDGRLVGYGGGLHRKQWLLELEANHSGLFSGS